MTIITGIVIIIFYDYLRDYLTFQSPIIKINTSAKMETDKHIHTNKYKRQNKATLTIFKI
jgi:hypothetical protein